MLIPEKVVLYALSPLNWDFPILEVDIKDAMEKHEKQWNEIKSQIQTAMKMGKWFAMKSGGG